MIGYIVAPSIMIMVDNPTEISFIDEEGTKDNKTELDKKTEFLDDKNISNYSVASIESNSNALASNQVAISFIPDPISPPPRI